MTKSSLSKIENRFWAGTAIGLGVWETTALTTKKIPTVSKFCYDSRRQRGRVTDVTIVIWLIGLGAHLLKRSSGL